MMRKKCFIGILAALIFCLVATSCSKFQFQTVESATDDFGQNFKAVVMGDKTIDPKQDWSTVASIKMDVSVDFGDGKTYSVYIYQTPPAIDGEAAYIGMAIVKSGETKTIRVIKPAQAGLLYAACYDSYGHAICKPFVAKESGTKVYFGGKAANTRSTTYGNNWSVPKKNMPDVSKYTSGNLIEVTDVDPDFAETAETHIKISSNYTGFLPYLTNHTNLSIYVTGTWTLTFEQRFINGNVLVVGNGGKVVIPNGFKISNGGINGSSTPGTIIIMPGGEISGEGTVEFANSTEILNYNAGTITTKTISIDSGILYNEGTLGKESPITSELESSISRNDTPSRLINHGLAYFNQIDGDGFSLYNSSFIQVDGNLTLQDDSKMDDGANIECGSLTLSGSSQGNVLYMGNQAYVNCKGDLSVDNYGVWGPSGNNYTSNAIFKINRCKYCNTTDGIASTYLLDHVELVLPEGFPSIIDEGALRSWVHDDSYFGVGIINPSYPDYYSVYLFNYWLNGYQGKMIDPNNYNWVLDSNNKYNFLWSGSTEPFSAGIDENRQTCIYSIGEGNDKDPITNYIYYAFEIADDNHDFNYNDVIFRLSTPTDNNDGTFTSIAEITAVGTSLYTKVRLKNESTEAEDFGKEIHIVLGTATTGNISKFDHYFGELDTLTFTSPDFLLEKQNFSLYIVNNNNIEIESSGIDHIIESSPTYIVVSGDKAGKWFWPSGKMNIALAYPLFNTWGSNVTTAPDWYLSSHADISKVLKW